MKLLKYLFMYLSKKWLKERIQIILVFFLFLETVKLIYTENLLKHDVKSHSFLQMVFP